jgi:hypothetical protein
MSGKGMEIFFCFFRDDSAANYSPANLKYEAKLSTRCPPAAGNLGSGIGLGRVSSGCLCEVSDRLSAPDAL